MSWQTLCLKYEVRGAVLFKRGMIIVNSKVSREKLFSLRIPGSDVLVGFLIFLTHKLLRKVTVVMLLIYRYGNRY